MAVNRATHEPGSAAKQRRESPPWGAIRKADRTSGVWILLSFVAFASLVGACASKRSAPGPMANLTAAPSQVSIGMLLTAGPNVWVNRHPASYGMSLYPHDHVATGSDSGAKLLFNQGGFVQLDANSDPLLDIRIEGGKCVMAVAVSYGNFQTKTGKCSALLSLAGLSWLADGKLDVKVKDQRATVTTFDGQVSLNAPIKFPIPVSNQVTFDARNARSPVLEQRVLTAEEMREVSKWWSRFEFKTTAERKADEPGWCCGSGESFSSTQKQCHERDGKFFPTEEQAIARCEQRASPGYCCRDGELGRMTEEECAAQDGFFSQNRAEARDECLANRAGTGYCCLRGHVIPERDGGSCQMYGGFFTTNLFEAESLCRQSAPEPSPQRGYCCINGDVRAADAPSCLSSGGFFSPDSGEALARCRPVRIPIPQLDPQPSRWGPYIPPGPRVPTTPPPWEPTRAPASPGAVTPHFKFNPTIRLPGTGKSLERNLPR